MAKRKVTRMLIALVVVFAACWVPSYAWWLFIRAADLMVNDPHEMVMVAVLGYGRVELGSKLSVDDSNLHFIDGEPSYILLYGKATKALPFYQIVYFRTSPSELQYSRAIRRRIAIPNGEWYFL